MYFRKLNREIIIAEAHKSLSDTLTASLAGLPKRDDADYDAYVKSIDFLLPVIGDCYDFGREYSCVESSLCFDTLRIKGRTLENKLINLFGVRTYVGAMFALGLFATAVGKLDALGIDLEREYLIVTISDFARFYCFKSFANLDLRSDELTYGERLYQKTSLTSMRGNAEEGFRTVLTKGLDFLEASQNEQHIMERLYLLLISFLDDSRVILDHGEDEHRLLQENASQLFASFDPQKYIEFDSILRSKRILPKAAMTMHSLCLFAYKTLRI